MSVDWMQREQRNFVFRDEVLRLLRRAKRRWLLVTFGALLLTALVVGRKARKGGRFTAEVVFRVVEPEITVEHKPPNNRELRNYVYEVAFSGPNLLKTVRKKHLYHSLYKRAPSLAIEKFKDEINIFVTRNYFIMARDPGDPPRSAYVTIEYVAGDPDLALEVAQELAHIVEREELANVNRAHLLAIEHAQKRVKGLTSELIRRKQALADAQARLPLATAAERGVLVVEIGQHKVRLKDLEPKLVFAEKRLNDLRLQSQLDRQNMGVQFELLDPEPPPRSPIPKPVRLSLLGGIVFVGALGLLAIGAGAFDPKIYANEDIRRLYLQPYGNVPEYTGHQIASLTARRQAMKSNG